MTVPIDIIREAFNRIHRVASGQSDRAYMSIPANPKTDADLIVGAAIDELEQVRAAKDGAYAERNKCVALLARMALELGWRAGVGLHPAEDAGWESDWRTILFIDLPTGQVSWHFHDSERHLLKGLPEYLVAWDGHSTDEKYRRVTECLPALGRVLGVCHCLDGGGDPHVHAPPGWRGEPIGPLRGAL